MTDTTPEALDIDRRPIEGFNGYEVGADGSVWSRRGPEGDWRKLTTYRRPYKARHVVVCIRDGRGVMHCHYVHRLVLEAFVGPCPPGMVGRHRDLDTANNTLSNLYWGKPGPVGEAIAPTPDACPAPITTGR